MIAVDDKMQRGYTYQLIEPAGKHFDEGFEPELTPPQLLELGVFGGKYMRRDLECRPRQRQALLHWAYDSRKI